MTDFDGPIELRLKVNSKRVEAAFLGEKQVATLLCVAEQWPRKCRANGTGPTWCKMEGCIRYPIEGIRQYVAETQCSFTGEVKHLRTRL